MKSSKDNEVGSLWQGAEKTFDELIKVALEVFYKKRNFYPKRILVNPSIDMKEFQGIPLVKDKQMYSTKLICMMYDNKPEKEKR